MDSVDLCKMAESWQQGNPDWPIWETRQMGVGRSNRCGHLLHQTFPEGCLQGGISAWVEAVWSFNSAFTAVSSLGWWARNF